MSSRVIGFNSGINRCRVCGRGLVQVYLPMEGISFPNVSFKLPQHQLYIPLVVLYRLSSAVIANCETRFDIIFNIQFYRSEVAYLITIYLGFYSVFHLITWYRTAWRVPSAWFSHHVSATFSCLVSVQDKMSNCPSALMTTLSCKVW